MKKAPKKAVSGRAKKPVSAVAPLASIREGVPPPDGPLAVESSFRSDAPFELPAHYGDDKIVLLVRDPWWIYAYWEVNRRQKEVDDEIRRQGLQRVKTILRIYDVTNSEPEHPRSYFDIEVAFLVGNWYVDVGIPDRDWIAELGFRASDGRFFPLVRSNRVRTPRFGVSDVVDEEWMFPDELYWKLFGLSGGLADRRSSLDVKEILEKYLRNIVSSAGMSSFSQSVKMLRNEPRLDVSPKILGE